MQTSRDLKTLDSHIPAHGLVGTVLSRLQGEQGGQLAHASQPAENKTVWKMQLSFKGGETTYFSTCSRGSEEQSTVHLKDPLGVLVPLTPAPGSAGVDAIWGQRPHLSKSRPVEVMLLGSTLAKGGKKTSSSFTIYKSWSALRN